MLLLAFFLVPIILAAGEEIIINNNVVKINTNTLKSVQPTQKSSHALDLSRLGLRVLEKNIFKNSTTLRNLNLDNNLAANEEMIINNYVVKINNNTLKSVQPTQNSFHALDLSGLGLKVLEENVFNTSTTLRNLNLDNNSLNTIPKRLFSKLVNLEHLCLANNNITHLRNAFSGLHHVKTLNISNNPLEILGEYALFGLPKSTLVFTKGLSLKAINSHVFGRHMKYDDEEQEEDDEDKEKVTSEGTINKESKDFEEEMAKNPTYAMKYEQTEINQGKKTWFSEETVNNETKDSTEDEKDARNPTQKMTRRVKVCIRDNVLKLVEPSNRNEAMPSDCSQIKIKEYGSILCLDNLAITKFEKGWCRLENTSIAWLSLAGNDIVEITSETLNDLPAEIRHVDLSRNKIKRLERGIIEIKHRIGLNMTSNGINEIEDDAFAETNLIELDLTDNLLKDTRFTSSLPETIYKIDLTWNKITEISANSFSSLDQLIYLFLGENMIQELGTDSFDFLPSLSDLELSNNRISKIQPGFFRQTPHLYSLDLRNNNICSFDEGVFDDVPNLGYLDVSYNKLSNLTENFPGGLPADLFILLLDFNEIEVLKSGTFVKVPRYRLSLDGNKISKIEQGAFDLPELLVLNLNNNTLTELNADSFDGLNQLLYLSLVANNITRIPNGFAKNLGKLRTLKLDSNPIKRLENGDLSGLRKSRHVLVFLDHVPVEIIEAGLFSNE